MLAVRSPKTPGVIRFLDPPYLTVAEAKDKKANNTEYRPAEIAIYLVQWGQIPELVEGPNLKETP